jgi:hypothetical protein
MWLDPCCRGDWLFRPGQTLGKKSKARRYNHQLSSAELNKALDDAPRRAKGSVPVVTKISAWVSERRRKVEWSDFSLRPTRRNASPFLLTHSLFKSRYVMNDELLAGAGVHEFACVSVIHGWRVR